MNSFEIIKPSKCCPNQQIVVKRHILTAKNADGNAFIALLVLAVWLGTVIWSSVAGWDELRKSNVQ